MSQLTQHEAVAELFRAGINSWMLKPEQLLVYRKIHQTKSMLFVFNCSRRWGKSSLLIAMFDEIARQIPRASLKYAAPTKGQVRRIIKPLFNKMLLRCPKHIRPWWSTQDSCFVYPNDSIISIVGCDKNNIDSLRGEETHIAAVDEAGSLTENLHYIINDILRPQMLTVKHSHPLVGKILIASTPPKSPAHPFVNYVTDAETSKLNNYHHATIYENTLLDKERILEFAKDAGCIIENEKIVKYSTTFRREYLAEIVTEESFAIIPEFNQDTEDKVVKIVKRPPHFDAYEAMDVGMIDLTVILFGYWDFLNATLVVEDEASLNYKDGINTKIIVNNIEQTEKELWPGRKPYLRSMGDDKPILCEDLRELHGLDFVPSDKDEKEAAINQTRLMIHSGKLIIHPRCKTLRAHLRYGIWDKNRKKFERSGEFGHFDAIDSLIIMVRNVNRSRNPYPIEMPSSDTHFINPDAFSRSSHEAKELEKIVTSNIINENS